MLKCAVPGCGEDAETVWAGLALCEWCIVVAFELPGRRSFDPLAITEIAMRVNDTLHRADHAGETLDWKEHNAEIRRVRDLWLTTGETE